jgi:hypothetical protein|tara:strand:- start:2273 stop:4714 length:2442 start_codon:yes stop_codon:yes gene_type:complete
MANVAGTTLADRNNNPVNLIDTNIPWQGAVGSNAGFETFSNPELGVRAAAKNLYTSQETHGNSTLAEIITRHAPPEDYNDTLAYIDKVSADLGIGPNDTLPNLKTHPHITKALITSMADMEGASTDLHQKYDRDTKFTEDVIATGVAMANGKSESEVQLATQDTDFDAAGFTTAKDSGGQETNRERGIRTDAKAKRIQTGKVTNLVAPNWLSTVDSPTYRWTLYIVDNDIWNDPNILGDDDAALKTKKAFIIAQQGTTTEFSLDNFAAMSVVTPGQRHGNTTPGVIQFDLFENLGFTFLDKALRAAQIIKKPANLHSQNYILKLEFLGRDPVTSASTTFNGIFFYPVKLNQIRSTTGPEGTRYNIIAWSMIKHAQTESVTDCDITIKNIRTVKDLTDGLVKQFNKGQKEAMNKEDFKAGRQPPKQIAIVFDGSSKVVSMPGTKTADIEENFTLETRIYSNITDSADSGGQNVSPDDPDTCDVTIERETSIPMKLGDLIQKNCKEWIDWQLELEKQGLKAAIVVDPTYEYSKKDQKEYAGKMLYASVEPILVTFTIKIYINKTSPDLSLTEHAKKLKDPIFQKQKINNTKIEKAYTFMYSGTNTEVLNYQIDVQNLYVVVDHPQGGQYGHGRGSDGEPQFAPTAIPTSPYLEDIPYTAESVFNDLVHGGATKADSAEDAQLNATGIDSRSALAHKISQMAKREYDAWKFDLEIKGDPYWMGNMQAIIKGKLETPDYSKRDALISFVQWNPNADKLLEDQTKGPIDIVSSGVYKLTSIESRFQGGKFTQTLSGYKDVTTNTSLVLGRLIELSGDM